MNKQLYYEIADDGYHIYDKNDFLFHIHQYEPYIPNKGLSYEENAKAQIKGLMKAEECTNEHGISDVLHAQIRQDEEQRTVDKIEVAVSGETLVEPRQEPMKDDHEHISND